MSRKKELVTAAVTIACALGIGAIMQGTDSAKKRYGTTTQIAHEATVAPKAPDVKAPPVAVSDTAFTTPKIDVADRAAIIQMPEPPILIRPKPRPETLVIVAEPENTATDPAPVNCPINATAKAQPGAIVAVHLSAPCNRNKRVAIHHKGLLFTATTDEQGQLNLTVPALAAPAEFVMAFADGDGAVIRSDVPDLTGINRFAVQYRSNAAFELEPHINDGDTPGGILTQLGHAGSDYALLASIYTLPAGVSLQDGKIGLSIKAKVSPQNCGHEINAQTFELRADQPLQSHPLSVVMPGCNAVGEFVVLNNILQDLKLASR